ncbi:MAG: hypothetical protein KDC80_11005 [Saprospiraceae bacterium]|nr:hypothetical protein [Saprospiraceae bacterium]
MKNKDIKSFIKPQLLVLLFVTLFIEFIEGQISVTEYPELVMASQNPSGGVFIPRNGGIEGWIGQAHVFFEQDKGGRLRVVKGQWPELDSRAELDMVFQLTKPGSGAGFEVRQSHDKCPRILFLEEGNDRLGLRVLFNLYDDQNIFHGHGMTEIWLHPDGQIFITGATMFENVAAHDAVTEAAITVTLRGQSPDTESSVTDMQPNGQIMLTSPDPVDGTGGLYLYWKSGRMDHNTYVYRSSSGLKGAPSFFRWPDYHRQAYTQRTMPDYINPEGEKVAWPPGRGAYLDQVIDNGDGVQLQWPIDNDANPTASFNAFFRLATADDPEVVKQFVAREKDLLSLGVKGGVVHGGNKGYNDQEGCYEVRKTESSTSIELPADPLKRMAQIKIIGLTGHGGIRITLDGEPVVPQLSSDGGIADDPLAPIRDQPEGPANAALVRVRLSSRPQQLVIEEVEGIQLTYQSRDPRRNFMIYSSKTGPRWSGVQFSLLDGHARHMREYGNPEWALTENLLQWFAYMGYSPEQMLDQLRDFRVLKNGPDEVVFEYTSHNASDGAQSVFEVHFKADAPVMKMEVHATFTVLQHWPYKSVQFFDIFPFRGVEPRDWWYDQALFMDKDYQWKIYKTVSQISEGKQDKQDFGPTFQGLYSSDRGNMLMLTKDFSSNIPTEYVICSNYIDLHSNVSFDDLIDDQNSLDKGYQVEVEYELAIWGDEKVTTDQMIDIAKKSIDAGELVIPD